MSLSRCLVLHRTTSVLLVAMVVLAASLTSAFATGDANSGGDASTRDVHTSGSFTINPAEMAVKQCREGAKSAFDHVRCFELAYRADPDNYTVGSSLSLAYLSVDLNDMAYQVMNHSASAFLKVNKALFVNETLPDGRLNITFLEALRRTYDDAERRNDTYRRDSIVDLSFMVAKMFEMDHRVAEAHALYYGFMAQLGVGDRNMMDFHRRTGNAIAMVFSGGSDTSIAFRISEAYVPILDGITEHLMGRRELVGRTIDPPLKRYCGIEIAQTDEVRVADVFDAVTRCVKNWKNFTSKLREADKQSHLLPFSVLRYTPAHRLAQVGAWPVLQEMLNYLDSTVVPADRFGRGLLHYAAAWGNIETIKGLVAFGGRLDKEDKGKIEPRHLGCASPTFDSVFEEVLGQDGCENVARLRTEDDAELADDSGSDGEWNPGAKLPKYLHCDFDVRDAARVTATDLLLAYVHSNQPVVLRNAFYDTDGPDADWKAKRFAKNFGDVRLRHERAPQGERFGLGPANTTTVTDFMATLKQPDGTLADVVVDTLDHPLYRLAKWTPATFSNRKYDNELRMLNAADALTTLVINKNSSATNHRARGFASFHATVFGLNDYTLLPPRFAKTTRGKLTRDDRKKALRCSLITGDVLVVPELWSLDYSARRSGVVLERYVAIPARAQRAAPGGGDNDDSTIDNGDSSPRGRQPPSRPPVTAAEEDTTDEL